MSESLLYVVMGTSGEYPGRVEWPVRAFVDERRAASHVVKAHARFNEIYALVDSSPDSVALRGMHSSNWRHDQANELATRRYELFKSMVNEYDPAMHDHVYWMNDNPSYYVMAVPLDDAVRQDIAASVDEDVRSGRLPKRAVSLGEIRLEEE